MKELLVSTLFGSVFLKIFEPDSHGSRSGMIVWSDLKRNPLKKDSAIEAIESLILAHACAGVVVESEVYVEGLNTVLEALDNRS